MFRHVARKRTGRETTHSEARKTPWIRSSTHRNEPDLQGDEFDAPADGVGGVAVHEGDATFGAKAGTPGVAGVEEMDAAGLAEVGFMGVAEDDECGFFAGDAGGQSFMEAAGLDDVMDQEWGSVERDGFGFFEGEAFVIVAQNGGDGGDEAEFEDEEGGADVAGVEDVIGAGENAFDPGIEVAVGIGDDANFHG